MDEIEFKDYTVTCETDGCENTNIPITLPAPTVNPYFICGACGQNITNVA